MYPVGPYVFTPTDAARTFANLGELWRGYVHELDAVPDAARDRAVELARRLAPALGRGVPEERATDPAGLLDELGADAARRVTDRTWPDDVIGTELAAAWSGIRAVGDELRRAGAVAVAVNGAGRIVQLSVSDGGVPKRAVDAVDVDHGGVVGDRQAARNHHGRPWQALCLWSVEVIDAFVAAGHSLVPGAAGENLTLAGIDWAAMRPGVRLRAGGVTCEISSYALPCTKNSRWFADGDHRVMHHSRGPVSRVYATVTEPGRIAVDDPVAIVR